MINNIKKYFSIKDLENYTGIKSHTIRIWEKRYALLKPSRTKSNIRYYDEKNFMKLLNVNLLYKRGYKISKIAEFTDNEISIKINELNKDSDFDEITLNTFIVAMLNYDVLKFNNTFNKLLAYKSFSEIFFDAFVPLLNKIGMMWQANYILPAHEHFISYLILQKIYAQIDKNNSDKKFNDETVYVLFLPLNEIHEIGLLYLYYELMLRNYKTIYLGKNIETAHLVDLKEVYQRIHFISYFTVEPNNTNNFNYIEDLYVKLIKDSNNHFSFLGNKTLQITEKQAIKKIKYFLSIPELLKVI